MVVELICVGTEILLGNIVNTNAAYLSEQCASLGLSCFYQCVVGDNEKRLMEAILVAKERSDIVILSGGLGPTQDDLTKETVAKVMGKTLYMDERSKESIRSIFEKRGINPTENNWKQALIPEGAIVIDNKNGTAPGLIMEEDGKIIILLPGPPNELIPMFEKDIYPYLNQVNPGTIYSKTVKICGVSESKVETMIDDLIEAQSNPTIAPYAKTGEVHLRITANASNKERAKDLLKPVVKELRSRFGENIYTTEEKITLEKCIIDLLIENDLTISTVESCSGGLLAARLINVAGISKVFKSGFITYSNKSKRKNVGVNKRTLNHHGAVSEQVAKEMAKGAACATKSDVTISITGIAGPDGGTIEKPVGLVYIGCSVCGRLTVEKFQFNGNRSKIREASVSYACTLLRKCILEYVKEKETDEGK
ncbi:MAG TPA: competence/damage-inducible protein A [Lachnospiraceae bacterium]|nr:competence/damage-inducible protein A [Lachnospiraceae bacterium]